MASNEAPTLSSQHLGNTLRMKNKKQKEAKKSGEQRLTKKNVLLSPYHLVWPQVATDVEEQVMGSLVRTLEKFPSLCPEVQKRKSGSTNDVSSKVNNRPDHPEDDMIRRKLRAQLAIGHRQVSKCLERDQLSLLLVWGQTKPAFIINCLIPLAATRLCPALCLQSLASTLSLVTGLTSVVAFGFKKLQPELKDFEDFVTMAAGLAPRLSVPWMEAECKNKDDQITDDRKEKADAYKKESTSVENKEKRSPEKPGCEPVDKKKAQNYISLSSGIALDKRGTQQNVSKAPDYISLSSEPVVQHVGGQAGIALDKRGTQQNVPKTPDYISLSSEPVVQRVGGHAGEKKAKGDLVPGHENGDNWPGKQTEELILGNLVDLLTPYRSVFSKPKVTFRSEEWKLQRKIIRNHLLTDPTTIQDSAKAGKLCLLLVQKSQPLHPSVVEAARFATGSLCPVLLLIRLRQQLASVIRNPLLAVMGFRKCEKPCAKFLDFTNFASQHASKDINRLFPPQRKPPKVEKPPVDRKSLMKKQIPKTPLPVVYNVSHLYVYKNDSGKPEVKEDEKQLQVLVAPPSQNLSDAETKEETKVAVKEKAQNYISLSSEPVEQLVGGQAGIALDKRGTQQNVSKTPDYISLPSELVEQLVGVQPGIALDKRRTKRNVPKTPDYISLSSKPMVQLVGGQAGIALDERGTEHGILLDRKGTKSTTPKEIQTSFNNQHQELTEGPFDTVLGMDKAQRRALKRKLKRIKKSEEYLSVSLYPANIRTSVSNVKKARKKRKQ